MKILSRILVALVVLLGIAFLVMQSRAYAADKAKCQGYPIRLGLDEKDCETKQPLEVEDWEMDAWLKLAGVKEECYRLRSYKDHVPGPYKGSLDLLQCITKEGAQPQKLHMMQPTGTGQTQRIMLNTPAAKVAFERMAQEAAKRKRESKKK